MASLVDAHVHADGLTSADLETLAGFGVEQVVVCAHEGPAASPDLSSAGDWLNSFDVLLDREAERFRRHGLRPLFALGVPPRAAPWRGLEELFQKLPRYLSHRSVVAIGALSLQTADTRELWVLHRQLELAASLRRPVIVGATGRAPGRGMRTLIGALRDHEIPPERVLIENAGARTLPLALACGFSVALEVSPGRLTLEEVVTTLRAHGAGRFVLTSHAGEGAANLLAVPLLAAGLRDAGLSWRLIDRVGRENALRLLGRAEPDRRAAG